MFYAVDGNLVLSQTVICSKYALFFACSAKGIRIEEDTMSCKCFVATRNDLEPGLRAIEGRFPLKYIKGSSWETPDVPIYASALDIPDLGIVSSGIMNDPADILWVMPASAEFVVKKVKLTAGGIVYSWDYRDNPSAFLMWPGGWYEGNLLGGGTCPTEFNPPETVDIHRAFMRRLTRGFVKLIGCSMNGRSKRISWWVGPEALQALDAGTRLITYALLDERYAYLDLKRPEPVI